MRRSSLKASVAEDSMQNIRRLLKQTVATRTGRIWLAVGFIAALTLAFAALLRALGQVDSFGDGWWWAVRHLVDPGALGDDNTWSERLLGLLVTLSGIVILIGVILEVLTEAVTRSLEYLDKTAIASQATDHVVFIGWSERLPDVIATLSDATTLSDVSKWSGDVVVLVPPEAGRDRDELRTRLRPFQDALQVQVIMAELDEEGFELANCRSARTIIVLRDDSRVEDPIVQDLESVRRALMLSRCIRGAEGRAADPAVAFEISRAANIDAATGLVPEGFQPLVDDRLLSALLRDTLLEPAWSEAMDRLLSPREQPQLSVISRVDSDTLQFGELAGRLHGAIPVALLRAHAPDGVEVAPLPDTIVTHEDRLIVVVGSETPSLLPPSPIEPADVAQNAAEDDETFPVLLIGWNSRVPTYCEELALTLGTRFRVTSLSHASEATRVAEVTAEYRKALDLYCITGDPRSVADLAAAMDAAQPKAIIITSTPIWGSASAPEVLRAADADALVTLMQVSRLMQDHARLVIVDPFDSSDADAFDQAVDFRTLPSTSIFASEVAWMVIEPDTERWIAPIFASASVRRASTTFRPEDGQARPFAAVHRALLDRQQVPIGVVRDEGLQLNPSADYLVNPGDRLLVIERIAGTHSSA
jgi:hypothetical protein